MLSKNTNYEAEKPTKGGPRSILLVDDDHRNIFALSAYLKSKGYSVVTAINGVEAIAMLKNDSTFEMILMDMMMPEMDGYIAMQKIRKSLNLTNLPIIALTARALEGDEEECLEYGATDYLSKPVDLDKLMDKLKKYMPK